MLKYLAVIILLMGFLGETFSSYIIVLDYQLNKEYIAKNLCENRNNPQMKCEGKCCLCKRLQKEDKKDKENPERKADNRIEIIPFKHAYSIHPPIGRIVAIKYPRIQKSIPNNFSACLFHPPCC